MDLRQFATLFNVSGIGLVLLFSYTLLRKQPGRFFAQWCRTYTAVFAILAIDFVTSLLGVSWPLTLVSIVATVYGCWNYACTTGLLLGHPLRPRWGWAGLGLALGLAGVVWSRHLPMLAAIALPALSYAICTMALGLAFLSYRAREFGRPGHWVGYPMVAMGLWTFTYPALRGTSFFWAGYWISGMLQVAIGMGMLILLLDVANRQLHEQNEQLKQLDELKMRFLSTVSHELRTPLTCIIGYLELMDDGLVEDGQMEQEVFMAGMQRSAQQLAELVNSLLDSVQIEKGQLKVECSNINFADAVHGALATLGSLAEKKALHVETTIPANLPYVFADPRRTEQVLINLINNAIKFTPDHGVIRLTATVEADTIVVMVQDTGVGIPAAKLGEIFQPFVQADNSLTRQHGGTGLGLSIAKSLIEAMEGTISVESVEGQGSTFRFTLPIGRSPAPLSAAHA